MEICSSFSPVVDAGCRVLVLGTMPGVASLAAQQYYAHPRNAFWPILYALWDKPAPDADYAMRKQHALSHGVAIWDVVQTCVRPGSSDSAIRDAQANDFAGLFAVCPGIHTVFHNGKASWALFDKLAGGVSGERERTLLPSTSPAYTLPFAEKLAAWQVVRRAAERREPIC